MTITLDVTKRDTSDKNETLRQAGNVPAIVYGPKHDAESISVNEKDLYQIIEEAGESAIVELNGLGETVEVLLKDVDFDPVKRTIRHADFYAIERGKEMTVTVPFEFTGEAPAEKSGVGTVTKVLHEVDVTCRPSNLPHELEVDVSGMTDEESKITIADLKLPEGVTIEADPEETVAIISVAREEEEEETEPAEVDMDAIEVEEKGKSEEASEGGEDE